MLAPGDLVAGKYRIERLLGQGGMGAVFVAVNEKLRKRVALKILRPEVARAPGASERFTREAIAASSAKHPGVIEIYDADVHDGLPWIAMELLEGESLGARVARGPLPLDEVIDVACQALSALAHVHRAGIVHRDLKPDNLFLETLPDGGRRVKILDFGIAASSGPELERVTQTGMAIGTPAYLAPEQAAGTKELDGRVDVYAMGVILFELITGRLPYDVGSLGEMVMRMYTQGPPPLAREAPHVPAELAALVDMCLVVDREHRIQSADALRRGLESLRAAAAAASPSTREIMVVDSPTATPIGHPSFRPAPHVHTPEAFAATMNASPATPMPAPTPPARKKLGVVALAGALGGLALAAAGAAAVVLVWQDAPEPSAAPEVVEAAPPVEPVAAIPEPPPMEPMEALAPLPEEPDAGAPRPRPARRQRPRPAKAAARSRPPEPAPPPVAPSPPEEEPRPLDNATITRLLQANEDALDRCYFSAYPERPRPRIVTEVDLSISNEGHVTRARIVGGIPLLTACAERVLSSVRFPAHPHGSRARFRMTFHDEAGP